MYSMYIMYSMYMYTKTNKHTEKHNHFLAAPTIAKKHFQLNLMRDH